MVRQVPGRLQRVCLALSSRTENDLLAYRRRFLQSSFTGEPYTQSVTTETPTEHESTPPVNPPGQSKASDKLKPVPAGRSLFTDPIPWLLLAGSLGLDQLSKALVVENLLRGESWPDDGFFRITHAWNTGTAFSLFQDQSSLLTFVSFAAVIALYFVYRSVDAPTIWVRMAFGLLLGGAFGNLIDRIRLGHVTDFVDIGPWPIFNVADSSIIVGIFVLFLFFWANPSDKDEKKDEANTGSNPDSGSSAGSSNPQELS